MTRGVWVFGPSRSGTSLTAGALAACGVFFGETQGASEGNRHGNMEHAGFKAHQNPVRFVLDLLNEGWDPTTPWGLKCGFEHRHRVHALQPTVAVLTRRPLEQIRASRERVGWKNYGQAELQVDRCARTAIALPDEVNVFAVQTDLLAQGDTHELEKAVAALGLEFDRDAVEDWIDPDAWHGR